MMMEKEMLKQASGGKEFYFTNERFETLGILIAKLGEGVRASQNGDEQIVIVSVGVCVRERFCGNLCEKDIEKMRDIYRESVCV